MKTTTALKASATYGGPAVFGAGAAMLAAALVTSSHYRPEAAAPRPSATVTVPQAPAPIAAPSPRRTLTPSPSTSGPTPATVQSVSNRQTAMPHTSGGGQSHTQSRPPSTPQPSPAAACGGRVLSVRALNDRACLSIGR